jgi:hypothetical protein
MEEDISRLLDELLELVLPQKELEAKKLIKEIKYFYDGPKCEITGCSNLAEYEGWWKVKDFAGNPTGLMQKRKVCEFHVDLLNK